MLRRIRAALGEALYFENGLGEPAPYLWVGPSLLTPSTRPGRYGEPVASWWPPSVAFLPD